MCGVKLMDKKSTKGLILMLDLNEAMDQLARAQCVHWYGHVLIKDRNISLRRALGLEVKGKGKWVEQRKPG